MRTTPMSIDNGQVTIHGAGAVWMSQHQLANMFGVFVAAIGANVRSILKNEILNAQRVVRERIHKDGSSTTLYNLEMITALAFRLKSPQAEAFRKWIVRQAASTAVMWEVPCADTMPN